MLRALELTPGHVDALAAFAGLLLDEGKYSEAEAAYRKLVLGAGSAFAGRLGRVEALIGLEQLDAAQVQLDAIPEPQRTGSGYREVAAKLAAYNGYICPVKGAQQAMEKVDPEQVDNELIFPTDKTLSQTHRFMALDEATMRTYEGDYADVTGA